MLKGQLGSQNRAGRRQKRASNEALAPGQIHLTFLRCRELIAGEPGKVIRAVGPGQPRLSTRGRAEAVGLSQKPPLASVVSKKSELFHRETVFGRKWEAVVWMVNHGYGHWIVRERCI